MILGKCADKHTFAFLAPVAAPSVTSGSSLSAIKHGAHWLIQSRDLLQSQNLVLVEHDGAIYRLQTTRLGQLILTK